MSSRSLVRLTCVKALRVLSVIILVGGMLSAVVAPFADAATTCFSDSSTNPGYLPGDPGNGVNQAAFEAFSWQTFLALNAPGLSGSNDPTSIQPIWAKTASQPGWSSTADILNQLQTSDTISTDPTTVTVKSVSTYPSFAKYDYPTECQSITDHTNYRVLEQVDKVNDSLFEAKSQGLTSSPVIDRFGNFLRYEILISPATYGHIVKNAYYTAAGLNANGKTVNMSCAATGAAAPTDSKSGTMTIKLAWMVDPADGTTPPDPVYDTSQYWKQKFLVYDPPQVLGTTSSNSSAAATCKLKNFLLVGMHIARKTLSQQGWIWSTFEHNQNAPDCTSPLPLGPNINTSCPAPSSTKKYNFLPGSGVCTGLADGTGPCQACNKAPLGNCATGTPSSTNTSGYCINQAPAATAGYSQLCRQAGPNNPYLDAAIANRDCQAKTDVAQTRWKNYELISTQWYSYPLGFTPPITCGNQASTYNNFNKVTTGFQSTTAKPNILPQVTEIDGTTTVPFLANTSMESYERSNCLGCHSKAVGAGQPATGLSSDFVYHLQFEVFQQPPQ